MKLPVFLLSLFSIFFCKPAFGQTGQTMSPYEAIDILKKGTLVVRLSTNTRKMAALEKMAASASKEKDRQRFQRMLEETRIDTRNQNLWLMEAFRENYDYSKLLFMPDTVAGRLKNGINKGIFLDSTLQIDNSLVLEGGFLVAFYGQGSNDQESSVEGLSVIGPDFQLLKHEFLFFAGRAYIWRMLDESLLGADSIEHYAKLVLKLQRRFKRL